VRQLVLEHAPNVKFSAPDMAYADPRKYLPALLEKRGVNGAVALTVLDTLESVVRPLEFHLHAGLQHQALQIIAIRDADDWPVLACAMMLGCPVWTQDADFFGTVVATWTSDQVALYLAR
jgi:predicted nucleic acid-binding protein